MIKQIKFSLSLTKSEYKQLIGKKPWKGSFWDNPPIEIKDIKNKIREQLLNSQSVCSYCGLDLWETSDGEVEHIAPKADNKNPEFTFTLKNLTFACHYCNSFSKKGNHQTINKKEKTYSKCSFSIVHPYFDNPDDYYEWTDNKDKILIQVKNNNPKAQNSIDLFKLASPKMNEARAKKLIWDEFQKKYALQCQDQKLLSNAINFKPIIYIKKIFRFIQIH